MEDELHYLKIVSHESHLALIACIEFGCVHWFLSSNFLFDGLTLNEWEKTTSITSEMRQKRKKNLAINRKWRVYITVFQVISNDLWTPSIVICLIKESTKSMCKININFDVKVKFNQIFLHVLFKTRMHFRKNRSENWNRHIDAHVEIIQHGKYIRMCSSVSVVSIKCYVERGWFFFRFYSVKYRQNAIISIHSISNQPYEKHNNLSIQFQFQFDAFHLMDTYTRSRA